jgi:hypothetical protein
VDEMLRRELDMVKEQLRRVEEQMRQQQELIQRLSGERPAPSPRSSGPRRPRHRDRHRQRPGRSTRRS